MTYLIYCSECFRYFGNRDHFTGNQLVCKCGKEIEISKCNFFLSFQMENQLRELLKNPEVAHSLLTYRFTRKKTNSEALEDICDGAEYQKHYKDGGLLSIPNGLSYSFNTDGVSMGKSCGKTIWPIYATINELPAKLRNNYELLVALYVGDNDPKQHFFLQPFVKQANQLSMERFEWDYKNEKP